MSEILIYNISGSKLAGVKLLCSKMNIPYRVVDPADYGRRLSYLLGLSEDSAAQPDSVFEDELLYLADISGGMLNLLLEQLRRKKLTVALKAVKTDTNIHFTSYELWRELTAEREAIRRGLTAHTE